MSFKTRVNGRSEDSLSPLTDTLVQDHHYNSGSPTMSEKKNSNKDPLICEEGPGICALIMTIGSLMLIVVSLPLSLLFVVKVVQEYERAVIFRLGRLLTGGARGPGVFFIIPCVDIYEKIDLRTATYEIPPQEILTKDSVTVFDNERGSGGEGLQFKTSRWFRPQCYLKAQFAVFISFF